MERPCGSFVRNELPNSPDDADVINNAAVAGAVLAGGAVSGSGVGGVAAARALGGVGCRTGGCGGGRGLFIVGGRGPGGGNGAAFACTSTQSRC
eukprot:9850397-Alexandrium_andersonii.AAC.1